MLPFCLAQALKGSGGGRFATVLNIVKSDDYKREQQSTKSKQSNLIIMKNKFSNAPRKQT